MTEPITENFSKNGKRKRGRPGVMSPDQKAVVQALYPDKGSRSLVNKWHGITAQLWLGEREDCAWLFEVDDKGDYKRETLHTELGRFPTAQSAYDAAMALCRDKPTVSAALPALRRWRQEAQGKTFDWCGDVDMLQHELLNALNAYLQRYPDMMPDDVIQALRGVLGKVIAHYEAQL